jgi:hypothetical protein
VILPALLLAAWAAADDVAPHPKCPEGGDPVFTGQPFRPLYCPQGGKEKPAKASEPDAATLPAKGGWSAALKGLDGRWRGIVFFAGNRYDATLDVSKSGTSWSFLPKDYSTHLGYPIAGEIKKPGWFSGGLPKLETWSPAKPGERLSSRFWLGANPAPTGPRRLAVWSLSGRPELHRVEFDAANGRLSGVYTLTDPARGTVGASFDLAPAGAE